MMSRVIMVVLFQPCGVVILTCSRQALRGTRASYSFFTTFVASLDRQRGLSSPTENSLCEIQAFSTTRVCAFMFHRVQHNKRTIWNFEPFLKAQITIEPRPELFEAQRKGRGNLLTLNAMNIYR